MSNYLIGVDVGTSSARAALVTSTGKIVSLATEPIKIWNPQSDYFEQSSDDIWQACVKVIKKVASAAPKEQIKGIGFDATCSLVVLGKDGAPIAVNPKGNDERNIIMWMDHRAVAEADFINSKMHPQLKYVGGKISLEMEIPKLLWLKKNMYGSTWQNAQLFFDLPDFLTWKATGSQTRSLCSLVCKWAYEIRTRDDHGWSSNFLEGIGLSDLLENNSSKIGLQVLAPGASIAQGLNANAAEELNLLQGTKVATSIIDAHAGGLGLIGCFAEGCDQEFSSRLSLICGTSTCHMIVSPEPIFADGIWGPYLSAMVPDMWLNEGGQSATGKLLDFVIDSHPASSEIKQKLGTNMHIQQYLSDLLEKIAESKQLTDPSFLTKTLHIWPDFHGNRSPIADPSLKGMISGLTLSNDEENLAVLYLAAIQSLAYGTKHIIERLHSSGHSAISTVLICGGLSRNPLFVQTQADVLGMPVLQPHETESVLLGAAILGAYAAGLYKTVNEAAGAMAGTGKLTQPRSMTADFHQRKYSVFLQMVQDQIKYKEIMETAKK